MAQVVTLLCKYVWINLHFKPRIIVDEHFLSSRVLDQKNWECGRNETKLLKVQDSLFHEHL